MGFNPEVLIVWLQSSKEAAQACSIAMDAMHTVADGLSADKVVAIGSATNAGLRS